MPRRILGCFQGLKHKINIPIGVSHELRIVLCVLSLLTMMLCVNVVIYHAIDIAMCQRCYLSCYRYSYVSALLTMMLCVTAFNYDAHTHPHIHTPTRTHIPPHAHTCTRN